MTQSAANTDVLQAYITGTLNEAQLRAFEDRLLCDESLVQELEDSLRLREGLEILRARQELKTRAPLRTRVPLRTRRLLLRALGAAAAAGILAVGLAVLYRQPGPAVVAASLDALHVSAVNPVRYTFAKLRGAAELPVLELPERGVLELRALTSASAAGTGFDVVLARVRGENTVLLGAVEHVPVDADGFVAVYVDASALQAGDYGLSVVADGAKMKPSDENTGERFTFRLQRSAR